MLRVVSLLGPKFRTPRVLQRPICINSSKLLGKARWRKLSLPPGATKFKKLPRKPVKATEREPSFQQPRPTDLERSLEVRANFQQTVGCLRVPRGWPFGAFIYQHVNFHLRQSDCLCSRDFPRQLSSAMADFLASETSGETATGGCSCHAKSSYRKDSRRCEKETRVY